MEIPAELWIKLLADGVSRRSLDHRDICVISMVCRRLRNVCCCDELWKLLWDNEDSSFTNDSPNYPRDEQIDWKTRYQTRFERVKQARLVAHRRRILRAESEVAVLTMECKELERKIRCEQEKVSTTSSQLERIEQASRASASVTVWQPEIVRTRMEQLIGQLPQDVRFHKLSLEMEAKVCRELVQRYSRSLAAAPQAELAS